jgi:NADH:ubiquinone oxidoreductase subunit 6 (subunit J)
MDTSSLKGLELLVIVGAVAWFYLSQQRNLKRLREEREAKRKEAAPTEGDG